MIKTRKVSWIVLTCIVLAGVFGLAWGIARLTRRTPAPMANAAQNEPEPEQDPDQEPEPADMKVHVNVIHPAKGLLERLSTQPGSIHSYESVRLFAKVPGFLKWQNVVTSKGERPLDIGDRVKRGQKLAVVDVPELEAQLKRNKAGVTRAEASDQSARAWVRYRTLQHQRIKDLFATRSIEEKLVDESKEHLEASIETEISAREAITAMKAKVVASRAKIEETQADVKVAGAEVEVAEAELEKVHVQVAFATIYAPFDGVVTQRGFYVGDYIRSANDGGNTPLITVDRTDLFRVVVQIPDRDVPFTDEGDPAIVQIDALPGEKFPAKVSRKTDVEDPQTRLMRIEIDLPNTSGKIRNGMYGQVTIVLDPQKNLLSIPSSCVVGKSEDGKATVFVVRDGHAHRVSVRLGADNGLRVGVLEGLTHEEEVIRHPGSAISEGVEVITTVAD